MDTTLTHHYRCPACKSLLQLVDRYFYCEGCEAKYPFLKGSIPILIQKIEAYVLSNIESFWRHIGAMDEDIQRLRRNRTREQMVVNRVTGAMKHNKTVYEEIVEHLISLIRGQDIVKVLKSEGRDKAKQYTFGFEYLKRDWCWEQDGEEELRTIGSHLRRCFSTIGRRKRVLVLGGGLARTACELVSEFDEVFVVDNSVSCAYFFGKLRNEDVRFYDINFRNIESPDCMCRALTASVSHLAGKAKKVHYALADVARLPFADSFFDCIVSVYFTDIVPLSILIGEVKRLLSAKGSFIHFGPLQYHFDNTAEMFSFDELTNAFKRENFRVGFRDKVVQPHLKSAHVGSVHSFTNWTFVASLFSSKVVERSSLIFLPSDVFFFKTGKLGSEGDVKVVLRVGDEKYFSFTSEGLEILELVGSGTTIELIASRLHTEKGFNVLTEKEVERLMIFFGGLAIEGVVTIRPDGFAGML